MTTTYDPKLHKIVNRTDLTDGMKDAAWEAFRDSNKPAPYNQVSDAVHAAISAAPEITLNQWQPIETAPRDGTEILGWNHNSSYLVRPYICWFGKDDYVRGEPRWLKGDGDSWSTGYYYTPCEPTHWMPLPDAPRKDGA